MASKTQPAYLVNVRLKGVSPLMTDCMTEEHIWQALILRQRVPAAIDLTREQIAQKKLYISEGVIGMPWENLFACLREAGRFVKVDAKKSVSTASSTLLPGILAGQTMFMPLTKEDGTPAEWRPDVRRGMLNSGGASVAVGLVRPKFAEWYLDCMVEVDSEELPMEQVRRLFDIAGKKIGLCSFRPQCNGPFGRFEVVGWEAEVMK